MTRADHVSGTDRIAEVVGQLPCRAVVNVQGDEPLIEPDTIDAAVAPMLADAIARDEHALPAVRRRSTNSSSPHVVKVVTDLAGDALYFSRAPIPLPAADARQPCRAAAGARTCGAIRVSARHAAEISRPARRARWSSRNRSNSSAPWPTASASASSTPATSRPASIRPKTSNAFAQTMLATIPDLRPPMENTARQTKYIFVTGGVVSSLGKGLAAASIGALLEGHGYKVTPAEVRPVHQRRPGHDEPVSARRGLRHRRRRRDRPRPGPLRAVHEHDRDAQQQLDHRQDLHVGDPEGAPRRLSRPHRAGDSAHHQRDQGLHPPGRPRCRRRAGRDRRHGRRHREPAVPRGDSPVPPGRRARQHHLRAPHAGAVHRRGRRAQDQADAAQRARPALDRHPARHPAVPHRSHPGARHQAEDRAVLRRQRRSGDHGARTSRRSTKCRSRCATRASTR